MYKRQVFFKSGADPDALQAAWRRQMPQLLSAILDEAAEGCAGNDVNGMVGVLRTAAERHGLFLSPDGKLCLTLLHHLDFYERARRTTLAMKSLLDMPVDVYGNGWDHVDWSGRAAVLRPPLTFPDMMVRLPSYLGSLSVNPLVSESVHDRVFFAIAAGVVPVADRNRFSVATMPLLDRYGYDFAPDSIVAAADALLTAPQQALERTESTYNAILPHFSLRESSRQIVTFASIHALNTRV